MKDFLSTWTDDVKHSASFLVGVLIEMGVEAPPTNDITDFSVFETFITFCCLAKSNSIFNVLKLSWVKHHLTNFLHFLLQKTSNDEF